MQPNIWPYAGKIGFNVHGSLCFIVLFCALTVFQHLTNDLNGFVYVKAHLSLPCISAKKIFQKFRSARSGWSTLKNFALSRSGMERLQSFRSASGETSLAMSHLQNYHPVPAKRNGVNNNVDR